MKLGNKLKVKAWLTSQVHQQEPEVLPLGPLGKPEALVDETVLLEIVKSLPDGLLTHSGGLGTLGKVQEVGPDPLPPQPLIRTVPPHVDDDLVHVARLQGEGRGHVREDHAAAEFGRLRGVVDVCHGLGVLHLKYEHIGHIGCIGWWYTVV